MEKSFLDVVKWQGDSVVVFTTFLGCSQGALGRREGSMLGILFDEFAGGVLCNSNVCTTFAPVLKTLPRTKVVSRTRENDSVAQLVEQVTLNHWVVSSSLTGVTKRAGTTSQ